MAAPYEVSIRERARSVARIVTQPIGADTRTALAAAWARLPERLRTSRQFLGRQYAGCGATIGVLPRCDFACRGCYLGAEANRVPAAPLEAIRRQLDDLRAWLGHGGNLQLTDGEVTLRPAEELIELIRYARGIGLAPMVFSHGDTFRRRPGLLERLMREGGLRELSLHIDTTMHGRRGFRAAAREEALHPLRDELAALIGRARTSTGQPLHVATTYTVTADNLDGVPRVLEWLLANPGVFHMISFQPISQVGRTEAGLGGRVGVDALWARIAEGLLGPAAHPAKLLRHEQWFGHPGCNRFVQGVILTRAGRPPAFQPLARGDDARDQATIASALRLFGGATTRLDTRAEAWARAAALLGRHPGWVLRHGLPYLLRLARRLDRRPGRLLRELATGRARLDYLNVVSHHFMSAAELATPLGQERRALCVFKVPVDGELVSMCAVNALGVRERYYQRLAGTGAA